MSMTAALEPRTSAPIRILICDDHVVFAESLAYLLASAGHDVVAVTHHPDSALAVLRHAHIDICMLDVMFGTSRSLDRMVDIRTAAPHTRTLLLTGQIDHGVITAGRAAGVRAITDKRLSATDILSVIQRVHAGETLLPASGPTGDEPTPTRFRPANDAQRLAAYLTPREREVLSELVRGHDTTKIAKVLGVARATARCHIQSVLTKIGAHSRLEAATTAVRYGMADPETGQWLLNA